jgi:hypothetical protein
LILQGLVLYWTYWTYWTYFCREEPCRDIDNIASFVRNGFPYQVLALLRLAQQEALLVQPFPQRLLRQRQGGLLRLGKLLRHTEGGFGFEIEARVVHPADTAAEGFPVFGAVDVKAAAVVRTPAPGLWGQEWSTERTRIRYMGIASGQRPSE